MWSHMINIYMRCLNPEFVNDDVFATKIIEKMQVKSQNPILIKFYIDEKFI